MTEAGARPARGPRGAAPCPLCAEPDASCARIATFRRGVPKNVSVVDCPGCGIFVFHDDTLADGPLPSDVLRRLRAAIHHGSPYNTPCDVTRALVAQARDEKRGDPGPPAI